MDRRRKGGFGLSLIELLVVLGIIGIISVVSVPFLARTGLFTSSKADLAAREVFNILRAAKIYATTHNVETAVAYGGLLVQDSRDGVGQVPVVDSVALVRKLTRKEFLRHNANGSLTNANFTPTNLPFVPLKMREGIFKELPNGTCILPDLFEFALAQFGSGRESLRGLNAVRLWDIDGEFLLEPRLDYDLNGNLQVMENIFPAHVFSVEGGLIAPEGRQRLRLRVGLLPDAEFEDRFYQEPGNAWQDVPVFFNTEGQFRIPTDPQANGTPIDIDTEILLYVATGRVKVAS